MLLVVDPVVLGVVQFAVPASAEDELAVGGRRFSGADFIGFRGQQEIRTNPGTDQGVTFAHPFQAFASATQPDLSRDRNLQGRRGVGHQLS